MTPRLRTYNEMTDTDRSGLLAQVMAQRDRVSGRLSTIGHVVAVMSGKGGVGKSFVTAAVAAELARGGRRIGVLDAGPARPTAARMLGVSAQPLAIEEGASPATGTAGVRVMSTDLLLPEGSPLRWKEPGHDGYICAGRSRPGCCASS